VAGAGRDGGCAAYQSAYWCSCVASGTPGSYGSRARLGQIREAGPDVASPVLMGGFRFAIDIQGPRHDARRIVDAAGIAAPSRNCAGVR